MSPRVVGLVADDLTGATDSAVQFAAAGWAAHLLRSGAAPAAGAGPVLLAVVTGARPLPADVAAERTAAAVRELRARGCERLYLKIDSTVRGPVAGQLRGAVAAWGETHPGAAALLCPAFPDQRRTVVGGEVLVDGVPVAATAAAHDPVTPVRDSRLDRLVPAAVTATPADLGPDTGGVVVLDAATDADLAAIAACADGLGPRWVTAGSAGLAAALARRWAVAGSPAPVASVGRVLVGVSSLHPVALGALARLRAAADPVDVVTTPAERADSAAVAAGFGEHVADRLGRASYDALVLVGGDGAAAALDRLGATAVTVHCALAAGVPLGTIVGGVAHGVRVVTTSGGFGDADSLLRIVHRLQTPTRKEPS